MASQESTQTGLFRRSQEAERRAALRAAVLLTAAIFATDLVVGGTIAAGSLYIVPVLISLWRGKRRVTLVLTGTCNLLIAVALVQALVRAPQGSDLTPLWIEHALAVFAIWVTASLGMMRMRVEAELVENRDITRTTLKSLAEAVITTDDRGAVTFMNRIAEQLTGWSRDAAQGRSLEEVYRRVGEAARPGHRFDDLHQPTHESQGTLLSRDGREIPIHASEADITDAQGQVRGLVLVFRDETERKDWEDKIRHLAFRDKLTGLPNRTTLMDRLELELAHARRSREGLALLFLDLDGFKAVNDTHGHQAGDALLVSVAQRLSRCLREGDTVARLGGDEFTIVLPAVGSPDDAALVANKVLESLGQPMVHQGTEIPSGCSIGIALFPQDGLEAHDLLRHADVAMYRAKQRGGRHSCFYGNPTERQRS